MNAKQCKSLSREHVRLTKIRDRIERIRDRLPDEDFARLDLDNALANVQSAADDLTALLAQEDG